LHVYEMFECPEILHETPQIIYKRLSDFIFGA
jgi:hypothetical protein